MPRGSKSVTPDGKKLRALRAKARKTQKEVIRGTRVQLRTYQRAEKGEPISQEILGEIAKCYGLSLGDLMMGLPREANRSRVRLEPCDGKGARILLRDLRLASELKIRFEVDPYGEVATIIADIVRFCKMHHAESREEIEEDAFIEAVGELNGKIAELYSHGVNVLFVNYLYWTIEDHPIADPSVLCPTGRELFCGQNPRARAPMMDSRFSLVFSEESTGVCEELISPRETKETAYRQANEDNFQLGINPHDLEECLKGSGSRLTSFLDHREYVKSYRVAWNERMGKIGGEDQLALPAPQTKLRLVE
jgi:transcriptional regulator with XRE-family HTH domain